MLHLVVVSKKVCTFFTIHDIILVLTFKNCTIAINSVTLLGRVGSNPVKRGSVDHPVVTFSLATNSNYSYANGLLNHTHCKNV